MKLRISPELTLPSDCVTGTLALLGRKRVGKTWRHRLVVIAAVCVAAIEAHDRKQERA